ASALFRYGVVWTLSRTQLCKNSCGFAILFPRAKVSTDITRPSAGMFLRQRGLHAARRRPTMGCLTPDRVAARRGFFLQGQEKSPWSRGSEGYGIRCAWRLPQLPGNVDTPIGVMRVS